MTTFEDQLQTDLDDVFYNEDEHAQEVTYIKNSVSPAKSTKIMAIVERGMGDEGRGADSYGVRALMRVQAYDVEQPRKGDEAKIEKDTWLVIGADPTPDGLEWICEINKRTA